MTELVRLRAAHPQACLLAGGTDIGLWVTKQFRELGNIIYLGHVEELRSVTEKNDVLEIGAAVTLDDAYRALCQYYPQELSELWQRFASLPIRHAGTLGGNVANGSPIGDSMPWLIALGSRIVLKSADGERELALEDFYLGYQQKICARLRSSLRYGFLYHAPEKFSVPINWRNVLIRIFLRCVPPFQHSCKMEYCQKSESPSAEWLQRRNGQRMPKPRWNNKSGMKQHCKRRC
jgi:hypothetical protein